MQGELRPLLRKLHLLFNSTRFVFPGIKVGTLRHSPNLEQGMSVQNNQFDSMLSYDAIEGQTNQLTDFQFF